MSTSNMLYHLPELESFFTLSECEYYLTMNTSYSAYYLTEEMVVVFCSFDHFWHFQYHINHGHSGLNPFCLGGRLLAAWIADISLVWMSLSKSVTLLWFMLWWSTLLIDLCSSDLRPASTQPLVHQLMFSLKTHLQCKSEFLAFTSKPSLFLNEVSSVV